MIILRDNYIIYKMSQMQKNKKIKFYQNKWNNNTIT